MRRGQWGLHEQTEIVDNVDKSVQKRQILLALKCNPKYKLNDVWQRFDITPEGDDWKVYERWQNDSNPS